MRHGRFRLGRAIMTRTEQRAQQAGDEADPRRWRALAICLVGGFMVRPAGDKDVQEAAQQAVALLADPKYLGAPAKLVKVKEAASQIVAGRNYRLTLDLTVKGKPASVSVVLYQPLKGAPKITKFKKN